MFKILKYGRRIMALEITDIKTAKEHLEGHMLNADSVLFVNDIEEAEVFDIYADEIEIIDPDE